VVDINEIVIVVQARMGSTRLPGKSMLPMSGTTVIGYLLKSLEEYGFSRSQLCVATSENKENKNLVKHVTEMGYQCFVGSELNVLSRYQLVASKIEANTFVRLTGDNPLIDPALVGCCIKRHLSTGALVTSTRRINQDKTVTRYVPKGSSVDIFKKSVLMQIDDNECDNFDREHVIPALFRDNKVTLVKSKDLKSCGIDIDKIIAFSIDTEDDYKKACQIVDGMKLK
jgi:spore coat polysaccharide biosynthesis protein SpsF (cytidylyltransferase family)